MEDECNKRRREEVQRKVRTGREMQKERRMTQELEMEGNENKRQMNETTGD
jgi:hypothetical protein